MRYLLLILLLPVVALARLSDVDRAFIEHDNLLENPSFVHGKAAWAVSTGSFSITGSGRDASATWDAGASGETLCSSLVPVPARLDRNNGYWSVSVQDGTASTLKAYVYDGSAVVGGEVTLTSSAGSFPSKSSGNFIFPSSGSVQLCIESQADEPSVGIYNAYLGDASNLTHVSQASFIGSAYIATTAGCVPTVTSTSLAAMTDTDCPGPTVEDNPGPGVIQTTDADGPIFTINDLPPGRYRVAFSGGHSLGAAVGSALAISDGTDIKGTIGTSTSTTRSPFSIEAQYSYSTTGNRTFQVFGSSGSSTQNILIDGANNTLQFSIYRYPLTSELALKADQTNRPWVAFTPTFTGFGTVANVSAYHKRQGEDMLVRVNWDCGTSTGTEARISLAGSYVSKSAIDTLEVAGYAQRSAASTVQYAPLIEPSVAYITMSRQGSAAGVTKADGDDICASGNTMSFTARIPIEGWRETMDAPLIKGSMVNGGDGVVKKFTVSFGGATEGTNNCTSDPCTIYRQSGGITSVTRPSGGNYTVTVPSGSCSTKLICIGKAYSIGSSFCAVTKTALVSSLTADTVSVHDLASPTIRDAWVDLECSCTAVE